MNISILVVDDRLPIAEGFKAKFERCIQNFREVDINAEIKILTDADSAVASLSESPEHQPDVLFTDIDLSGDGGPDKAGVALARFARNMLPDMPIVGYSGYFGEQGDHDLGEEDRRVFDRWWPKGGPIGRLAEIANETLLLALESKRRRMSKARGSHANPCEVQGFGEDNPLLTPTSEQEFHDAGYTKRFIEPTEENGLVVPFAVWAKESDEGVELEVMGCGALFTWGEDYIEAEALLIELIRDYKSSLSASDETFSPSMLKAKRFVQSVTGFRNSGEI